MRPLAIALIGLYLIFGAAVAGRGADASLYRSFVVRADFDQFADWLLENQGDIVTAAKCVVVSRDQEAKTAVVIRQTVKGDFKSVIHERIQRTPGRVDYIATTVPDGQVRSCRIQALLVAEGRFTRVSVWASADVDGYRRVEVAAAMSASLRGVERMMLSFERQRR